jgi:hypothetical protein
MIPYNLPPNKCMKEGVMFLALIVPGPKDPVTKINVFMQPLIEELKVLWHGVEAYDSHVKRSFTLCATYLWSIHDLLAYDIFLAGVSTAGCVVRYLWVTRKHIG